MRQVSCCPRLLLSSVVLVFIFASISNVARSAEPEKGIGKAGAARTVKPREGISETITLFNGKDLSSWIGHSELWTVKDGMIVGKHTEPTKVSTYLLTERKFTDFRLLASGKLIEDLKQRERKIHSGIAFWGRNAPERGDKYTFAGHLLMFPYEWGLYEVFGRGSLPVDGGPAKKVGKDDDWNQLEILALGNRIQMAVNGAKVVDWCDPDEKAHLDGPIGLQLHANKFPQEVNFRDLVVTTFPTNELITIKK